MTGKQLRAWRESMRLSLRDVAQQLGDKSFSAISLWEKAGDKPIPAWAVAKLLGQSTVTLPLDELVELVEFARANNLSFVDALQQALREYVAARRSPPENVTQFRQSQEPPAARAAEDPAPYRAGTKPGRITVQVSAETAALDRAGKAALRERKALLEAAQHKPAVPAPASTPPPQS